MGWFLNGIWFSLLIAGFVYGLVGMNKGLIIVTTIMLIMTSFFSGLQVGINSKQ